MRTRTNFPSPVVIIALHFVIFFLGVLVLVTFLLFLSLFDLLDTFWTFSLAVPLPDVAVAVAVVVVDVMLCFILF